MGSTPSAMPRMVARTISMLRSVERVAASLPPPLPLRQRGLTDGRDLEDLLLGPGQLQDFFDEGLRLDRARGRFGDERLGLGGWGPGRFGSLGRGGGGGAGVRVVDPAFGVHPSVLGFGDPAERDQRGDSTCQQWPEFHGGPPSQEPSKGFQASGSSTTIVVPLPGSLSTSRRPPWFFTMPRLTERPRPVPWRSGLVV